MVSPITISTRELEKSYSGKRVVNKVNINVTAGEVVGLLGPNGAGKTTTFYMIVGLIPATRGKVLVGNVDITVICDEPKLGPHKEQICDSLRTLIGAPVNIKGKTHEGMDRIGAIEVHALALVQRSTKSS